MRDKDVGKHNFSKVAVFLLIGVVSLMLPGEIVGDHHPQQNDWTYIGTSKEGVKVSYSPERTVKRGKLIQSWFKNEHPDTDQKISSSISLHEFNCPEGTYRLLQGTLFFRDGGARSSNQPSAWEHPLPESVAEMEFNQVCPKTSSRKNNQR